MTQAKALPISLTLSQQFEVKMLCREIDKSQDLAELRSMAKNLLIALKYEQAASAWLMHQSLSI
ncbi:hypothetical protein OAA28_00390 [bacterium]|nr:hypothetical protein [bacterium]